MALQPGSLNEKTERMADPQTFTCDLGPGDGAVLIIIGPDDRLEIKLLQAGILTGSRVELRMNYILHEIDRQRSAPRVTSAPTVDEEDDEDLDV